MRRLNRIQSDWAILKLADLNTSGEKLSGPDEIFFSFSSWLRMLLSVKMGLTAELTFRLQEQKVKLFLTNLKTLKIIV